jgi:hypothetical protein
MPLSRIQDELGWDCFLEGRIPIALLESVKISLPSRQSITKWGISLIKALLSVTHRQWLFRNADVHHRFDGLTMHGHNLLSLRIYELLETSPGDLLPVHRYLLQQDFSQLGTADTIQQQIWVATMESALVLLPVSIQDTSLQVASIGFSPPGNALSKHITFIPLLGITINTHDALFNKPYLHPFLFQNKHAILTIPPPVRI